MDKSKIFILTNMIPEYRIDFYKRLEKKYDINLYTSSSVKGVNIPDSSSKLRCVRLIRYVGLHDEKFGIQLLPLWTLIIKQYDFYVIYGNPRIITNVILSLILKLFSKRIIIWGQYGFNESPSRPRSLRLAWWKLFNNFFVYNRNEEIAFHKDLTSSKDKFVVGMNNGLDNRKVIKPFHFKKDNDHIKILAIGRHVKKNKYEILIKALAHLRASDYVDIQVTFIGDGPEKEKLLALAIKLGVENNITMLGEIYDERRLAENFYVSDFLVHPGGVGLSVVHGFQYGLPTITSNVIRGQMPEYSYIDHLSTGYKYGGEEEGLAAAIIDFHSYQKQNRDEIRKQCLEVAERCNTKNMFINFTRLIELITR